MNRIDSLTDFVLKRLDVIDRRCEYDMGESRYGAGDSLPCGKPADDSGFCAKHKGEMGI